MSSTKEQRCICSGQTFGHPEVSDLEIYYLGPLMEFGRAAGLRFTRLMDTGGFLPPVIVIIPKRTVAAFNVPLFDQKATFNFELVDESPSANNILGKKLLITPVIKKDEETAEEETAEGETEDEGRGDQGKEEEERAH